MQKKKHEQLGMNAGSAAHRLLRDILFKLVSEAGYKCFRCGGEMTRENYSIDHKEPWLDSEDPAKLFFDLDNVAFSHRRCNYGRARRPYQKYASKQEREEARRKREAQKPRRKRVYNPAWRRDYYRRTGK